MVTAGRFDASPRQCRVAVFANLTAENENAPNEKLIHVWGFNGTRVCERNSLKNVSTENEVLQGVLERHSGVQYLRK